MGLPSHSRNNFPSRHRKTLHFSSSRIPEENRNATVTGQVCNCRFFALRFCKVKTVFSQLIMRARMLRENCKYIPRNGFLIRRHAFNKEDEGYLTQKRPSTNTQNMMTDPTMMTDMLKSNLTNVLPMIIIGGWINWMFSGFITSKKKMK